MGKIGLFGNNRINRFVLINGHPFHRRNATRTTKSKDLRPNVFRVRTHLLRENNRNNVFHPNPLFLHPNLLVLACTSNTLNSRKKVPNNLILHVQRGNLNADRHDLTFVRSDLGQDQICFGGGISQPSHLPFLVTTFLGGSHRTNTRFHLGVDFRATKGINNCKGLNTICHRSERFQRNFTKGSNLPTFVLPLTKEGGRRRNCTRWGVGCFRRRSYYLRPRRAPRPRFQRNQKIFRLPCSMGCPVVKRSENGRGVTYTRFLLFVTGR